MAEFNHGLSPKFINKLAQEAKKDSWWTDVLDDPDLFVAVRDDYLNVYWRGQSLFRADQGLGVTTHPKFLVDPDLANQVPLFNGKFDVGKLVDSGFISRYEGRETLDKMKIAAGLFSGLEKTGCHDIILANPQVIDCEIAFPGNGGPDAGAPRVDLLSLEPDGALVFWEAKHFNNSDLRARNEEDVPVCKQINCYRQYLSQPQHRNAIEKSYKLVVQNLVAIDKMRRQPRQPPLPPQVSEAADGSRPLTLGAEPKVGLVIFGFDKAERDDPRWKDHHLKRLKKKFPRVVAAGDAKNIQLRL